MFAVSIDDPLRDAPGTGMLVPGGWRRQVPDNGRGITKRCRGGCMEEEGKADWRGLYRDLPLEGGLAHEGSHRLVDTRSLLLNDLKLHLRHTDTDHGAALALLRLPAALRRGPLGGVIDRAVQLLTI